MPEYTLELEVEQYVDPFAVDEFVLPEPDPVVLEQAEAVVAETTPATDAADELAPAPAAPP